MATPGRIASIDPTSITVKSRNSNKRDTQSGVGKKINKNIVDLNGTIRLPSMAKCLQFKILPREQSIIKDFFNMRILNSTPVGGSANVSNTSSLTCAIKNLLKHNSKQNRKNNSSSGR